MFFPLSWTVVHPIDETSPLPDLDAEGFRAADAQLLILLSGIDQIFSQTVHTRTSSKPDEVVWNARFAGIFDSPKEGQHLAIDLRRLRDRARLLTVSTRRLGLQTLLTRSREAISTRPRPSS